jgi:hypothetical protein
MRAPKIVEDAAGQKKRSLREQGLLAEDCVGEWLQFSFGVTERLESKRRFVSLPRQLQSR